MRPRNWEALMAKLLSHPILRIITIAFAFLALTASRSFADHERFIVGQMRNIDPSQKVFASTSGACISSHDRITLECYFTSFGIWKVKDQEQIKRDVEQATQQFNKDSGKQLKEFTKSFCGDKRMAQADPVLLKYDVAYRTITASAKAFCEHPSRDSALGLFRTMSDMEGRKCYCLVTDWHSTFTRQNDRWVENTGPNGLCGVIKVFTLVPHDIKKMKEPTVPVLWTLTEKTVTTHGADNKLCGQGMFKIEEGVTTVSWECTFQDSGLWRV